MSEYRRVWLIPYRYPGGDPNSMVEHMLNYRTYEEKCEWTGPSIRLCLYRNEPPDGLSRQDKRVEATFGDQISLRKTAIGWRASRAMNEQAISVLPGETLYVDLLWTARASTDRNYKFRCSSWTQRGAFSTSWTGNPWMVFAPQALGARVRESRTNTPSSSCCFASRQLPTCAGYVRTRNPDASGDQHRRLFQDCGCRGDLCGAAREC